MRPMRLTDKNPAITQKEMKEKMGALATIKRLMSNL
ncbi:hypothetical protein M2145_001060 [Lachnospiraceae bacterium PF1-21]